MESLEQVPQFARCISPREGFSALSSSCGRGKGDGSTEQSLGSLMAQTPTEAV